MDINFKKSTLNFPFEYDYFINYCNSRALDIYIFRLQSYLKQHYQTLIDLKFIIAIPCKYPFLLLPFMIPSESRIQALQLL